MTSTAKNTILIPIILLVVSLIIAVGLTVMTFLQKAGLEKQNQDLMVQMNEIETKGRELKQQIKKLEEESKNFAKDMEQKARELENANKKVEEVRSEANKKNDELSRVRSDRNDLEVRLSSLSKERDELVAKIKDRPAEGAATEKLVEKIVYMDQNGRALPTGYKPGDTIPGAMTPAQSPIEAAPVYNTTLVVENTANETYWAGVMRQKAALEIELADIKKKLTERDIKIGELLKGGSDLEIELGRLKNEKAEIISKIKYGEDLADNLSIELARARNDQKMVFERADKVNVENEQLRAEIKNLTTTKVSLEKSVAQLAEEKTSVEKKLIETENIIQSRIDDIWKIKQDVDTRFKPRNVSSGDVELAPIVVTAGAEPNVVRTAAPEEVRRAQGSVASINEDNNFVVINVGEKDGVRVGDTYKVYRGNDQVGVVSVIQVRKDIAAADIKQKSTAFKVGDTVK